MPPNAEKISITLQPHQWLFKDAPAPIVCLDGGLGSGKTMPLCLWALEQCERYQKNVVLLGRQAYSNLADSTIPSFFDLVNKTRDNWNGSTHTYLHPNGSVILFRHLDTEKGLKGLNLGAAGIDQAEELHPSRFDLILGQLRRPTASRTVRIACNPNGHDWIWQMFYGPGSILWQSPHVIDSTPMRSPDARAGYQVIRCTSKDNHFLPPDYLARMTADYSEQFVQQYVYASREVMIGYRYFNPGALQQQVTQEPEKVGHFVDGFPKPEWREQPGGPVRIYEAPYEHDRYVIGGDVATGEGFSWCAGIVLNTTMNRVAAVFDADARPDELAVQLWLLSRTYYGALIAPERNGIGFSVVTALSQLTGNLFHGKLGDFGAQHGGSGAGWLTDGRSRAELFAECQRHIAKSSIELRDRQLIEQCMAVTMSVRGRPEPEEGFRDDLVIALGIALMVRKLRPELQARTSYVLVPTPRTTEVLGAAVEGAQGYGFGRMTRKVAGR